MFKKLFGGGGTGSGSSSTPAPAQASTASAMKTIGVIQNLTEHEETLEKRKALLEKRIEAELAKAQDFLRTKRKPQALQCMKRKKLLEGEVQNLDNMIMRVSEQKMMLEGQRTAVDVVSAMHQAAVVGKENLKATKIENVDKVLDEINETTDSMRAIQEAFSNPTGAAADLDEDELMAELNEMEGQQLEEELLQPAPVPVNKSPAAAAKLPTVPAHRAPAAAAKTQEELELEALQAEMAL